MTGLAWNEKSVTREGEPFRIPFTFPPVNTNFWDRWATAVKLRFGNSRTDVVFIPVHMKANVPGNFQTQRLVEARILVSALGSVRNHFNDRDIIILGDTNVLRRTEGAVSTFTENGFVDLNRADVGTHGTAPFDRAFLSRNQPEFADSSLNVFRLSNVSIADFRTRFSDHLMIRFDIRVMSDDDN